MYPKKNIGTEQLLGWFCYKHEHVEIIEHKVHRYTIWIRYSDTHKPFPVRYEVKGWDNLIGAHYDHYHLDYDSYSNAAIPDDIFKVNEGDFHLDCISQTQLDFFKNQLILNRFNIN